MFQNVTDTIAEAGLEVVHNEMGEGLANRVNLILQVVAKDHIVETEVGRWAIRHMTDDKTIGFTSSLMHHNQISKGVSLGNLDEILEDVATSVNSSRVR